MRRKQSEHGGITLRAEFDRILEALQRKAELISAKEKKCA
jgi:hypothetical protein